MKVEYVSRICLASGRSAQNEGDLAIGYRLLGQVVIYYQGMASCVPEILPDCRTGKRSIVPQCSRVGCSRSYHYRIVHRALFLEGADYIRYRRALLAYCHIYAEDRFPCLIGRTLVDDRVKGYGCLSCLTVTDDELSLAPAYRNHRIYCLESSLQRLGHRLTEDHPGSLPFKRHLHKIASDGTLAVERLSKRVHHTAYHAFRHIYGSYPACPSDRHPFLYPVSGSQQDSTHIVLLQVHHHCLHPIVELQQFSCLRIPESVYPHHSVTHLQHLADFLQMKVVTDAFELVQKHLGNLSRAYVF